MKSIEFWKMSGSGNDFILIDNRDERIKTEEMGPLVKRICRRRDSVGADGVIFVVESDQYDFGWRFFNADASEVEMCGNGGRCVSRFAYLKGIAEREMTFETLAGPVSAVVDGSRVKIRVPDPSDLLMGLDLVFQPGWKCIDFINTGVPHVVVQIDDFLRHPVIEQGRTLRYHAFFKPEGTNANFMVVAGPNRLKVRTYERGVEDETLACGTGAIACALVSVRRRAVLGSPVHVETRSGETLTIYFSELGASFEKVALEGNTAVIYRAQLSEEAFGP